MPTPTTPLKLDPVSVSLILQILVQYGPEAYQLALNLFKAPAGVVPSDFDALTLLVNKSLHQTT